jgi:lipoprotein-anchoring transpeptidase ErfK/SrfK
MRLAGAVVGCLLAVPACIQAAPATAAAAPHIAAHQETVALLASASVRGGPALDAKVVASVPAKRPMTGARTVLPLLGQAIDSTGGSWLHVRLPGRALKGKQPPESGWISAARTRTSATDWHLVVNRAARSVTVYRNGQKLRSYKAIVGKSSTPTPRGEFFVEENVRLPGGRPGAPFALATSARSSVFQEFEGGPGQIALHGLTNVGGSLGTAVSHGCVRMANRSISWLAARIKPGDPITIV